MAIRYRIAIYAVCIAAILSAGIAFLESQRPKVYSIPSSKVNAYLSHKDSYSMLFIGDSRTYADIQPRMVDPLTGRISYNLASFGLWIPVQYLEFRDVFSHVPANTVVVWSLSHRNFMPLGDRWWIPGQYKFTLTDVAEYFRDGYPPHRILQEYEESPNSPVDRVVGIRKKLMSSLDTVVWKRSAGVVVPPITPGAPDSRAETNRAAAVAMIAAMRQDSHFEIISPVTADGLVNAVEDTRTDGGYDRIPIDHDAIRRQQAKVWPAYGDDHSGCTFVANAVYMTTFSKILALASQYRLKMIVNYIEDAPGSWASETQRQCARKFMRDSIAPILAKQGIEYIAPDLYPAIGSSNDFYFDDSHLMTEGAGIYSRLLGTELQKTLVRKGW
ncbi:MAG TPA: hypothetical protein VGJ09_19930 [Bryobacteraceae bacterium]